jgi:malonate transporter MadL subunit
MAIYGTALLSLSLLVGLALGRLLGRACGLDADIGGVGIAMLLLIFSTDWLHRTGRMKPPTEDGIRFWGSIYIPVVVAMAATQNVRAALSGGVMATLAGALGVAVCFALVGVFTRLGGGDEGKGGDQ